MLIVVSSLLAACASGPATTTPSPAPSSPDTAPDKSPTVTNESEPWKGETIALPPSFAPDMLFSGQEEIRFAPGMFDSKQPDFFSYVFVFRYPELKTLEHKQLVELIEKYYSGLMSSVAGQKEGVDEATLALAKQVSVDITASTTNSLEIKVHSFDAFSTMAPITLNMKLNVENLGPGICVRVQTSPQGFDHEVWRSLGQALGALSCQVQ